MKVIVVILTVAAVLTGGAAVQGAIFGWDGGGSGNSWQTAANWRSDTGPGCSSSGTDTVEILASSLVSPFNNLADWDISSSTCQYSQTVVTSNTSYAMTLKKSGSGTFKAGDLQLTGFSSGKVTLLDVDDDNMNATGLRAASYVDLDVASGKTLDVNGALDVTAAAGVTDCEKLGSGTTTPDTIYCRSGTASGYSAKLLLSAGTTTASASSTPFTSIEAAATVTANAIIEFDAGSFDPGGLRILGGTLTTGGLSLFDYDGGTLATLDALRMSGWSKVDVDEALVTTITVDGDLLVSVEAGNNFPTDATIELQDAFVIADKIQIGGGQVCTLTVTGGGYVTTDGSE